MRNLAFTGFGGFQMGLFMLKNSEGNHEGRINKFDGIEVTNFFSQSKVAQMGKHIIFSANRARSNNYVS